jgi:hypothetical protein
MNEIKELLKYMYKDISNIIGRLYDKVAVAHSYTSEIWIYYGLLVFLLFIRWAG